MLFLRSSCHPLTRAYSDARAHPLRRVVQGSRAGRQRVAAALRVVYFSSRERYLHNDALRRRPSRRGALRPASPSPSRQSTPLRHPTPWRLRRSPEAHPRLPCALGRHRAMCVLYTKGCIATPADARPKLSPQLGVESAVSSGIKKSGACMITMTPRAGLVFLVSPLLCYRDVCVELRKPYEGCTRPLEDAYRSRHVLRW